MIPQQSLSSCICSWGVLLCLFLSNSPLLAQHQSGLTFLGQDTSIRGKVQEKREDIAPKSDVAVPESQTIAATSLLIWDIIGKREPSPATLKASGLSLKKVRSFIQSLSTEEKLSPRERSELREEFRPRLFQSRLNARRKILNTVSKFQKAFPSVQSFLPELLTVWGEARGIRGFQIEDDQLQQAKMATIVHVLRNRALRQKVKNPKEAAYEAKWRVATKRFQFSAFEPYDPNLAELSMGPPALNAAQFIDPKESFEAVLQRVPMADRRALKNLSEVLVRMDRGDIAIPKPLGDADSQHYLTPTLLSYSVTMEKKMRQSLSRRLSVLRFPDALKPRFLAVVPRWARQGALISEPPVDVLSGQESKFTRVSIPIRDFVYFKGVL